MARKPPSNDGETLFDNNAPQREDSFGQQDSWSNTPADLPMPWSFASSAKIQKVLAKRAATEIKAAEKIVGRQLTSSEQECMAYWSAREIQIGSRGLPIGILAGFYRAYSTRARYQFPFYRPSPNFNPDVIMIAGNTVMKGARARLFWHFNRAMLYGAIVGPMFGTILFGSYASARAAAGRATDSRMKDIVEGSRQRWEEIRKSRGEKNGSPEWIRQQKDAEAAESTENIRKRYGLQPGFGRPAAGENAQASSVGGDNNSPFQDDQKEFVESYSSRSAANYSQENSASPTNYNYDSSTTTSPNSSYSPQAGSQQKSPPLPSYEQSRQENKSSGFFDDDDKFDDASPTAVYPPQSRSQRSSQSPPSRGGSNSWERIRSGNVPSQTTNQDYSDSSRARDQSSSDTDSGSYSRADEDRQLARSQAQKDFDASLERERRGKNFD